MEIDNDLYQTFVNISQNFVDKHADKICFDQGDTNRSFLYCDESYYDSDLE